MGASAGTAIGVVGNTFKQLKWPIFTIAMILGFAYIINFSGMAITLVPRLQQRAQSSRSLQQSSAARRFHDRFRTPPQTHCLGNCRQLTAEKIGVDPVITMSANTCGGVCGKM